jgi:hypothetical protein
VNCILKSGLLCVTLSLVIAKHKQSQSRFSKSCHSRDSLSQAVDTLYVKAAGLKATIPVSIRLCLEGWYKGHCNHGYNLFLFVLL